MKKQRINIILIRKKVKKTECQEGRKKKYVENLVKKKTERKQKQGNNKKK